jgi:ArsR family transcriptional regulator
VRSAAAERLKVLGHPDRLRMVEVLTGHPMHVGEIAARIGLPLGTVSRHVRALHAAGIVKRSRHGNRVVYAVSDREVSRLAAVAYRGAATQARRMIAAAPELPAKQARGSEAAGTRRR